MKIKLIAVAVASILLWARPGGAQLLYDDFTADTGLDTGLWTSQSTLLGALAVAANPSALTLVAPVLTFGPSGMEMAGVTNIYEIAAIQSLASFSPPFTVSTGVNGLVAYGYPFQIYIANESFSEWISIGGNVGAINGSYYGVWLNDTGSGKTFSSRGVSLLADPSTNVWYGFQIAIAADGTASVAVTNSTGVVGVQTDLQAGAGPFYLFLAQREGYPAVIGPNVAIWQSVSITTGAAPPPSFNLPPLILSLAPAPAWSAQGLNLELQGPAGNYQVEASTNLSSSTNWQAIQTYSTNSTFDYFFLDSAATNYTRRFYRAMSQ